MLSGCYEGGGTPVADNLYKKGRELYDHGEYVEAMLAFTESNDAAVAEDNDSTVMRSLLAIGNVHTIFDDYEQAVRYYTACYTKALDTGNKQMQMLVLNNLLICHGLLGNGKEAVACFNQLKTVPSRGGDLDGFYSLLHNGLVAQAQHNLKMAEHFYSYALDYIEAHDMDEQFACSLFGMIGKIELQLKEYDKAEKHFLACLEIAEKDPRSTVLCSVYEKLTELYRAKGDQSKELYYHHLNNQLTDSAFNRRMFYDKEHEIVDRQRRKTDEELLTLNNRISQQLWIIGIIGTLLVVLLALVIIIVRQNRNLVSAQRLLVAKHREHLRREQKEKELREEYLSAIDNETASSPDGNQPDSAYEETHATLLDKQQAEALLSDIARVMTDKTIISDPDFSLQQLAQLVESNTKYVSWVINNTYNKNFKTFLNDYRIEEASKILVDRESYGHLTLKAICLMVGFKSTTSFNAAFKRVIGMTPSAYQRLYAEEQQE